MKILSFNINNDYRDQKFKTEEIVNLIDEYKLDILGLQEVTPAVYNLLYQKLNHKYYFSPKKNQSYFNVLISLYPNDIVYHEFVNTDMNRGFVEQKIGKLTIITTHLESGYSDEQVKLRKRQIVEILGGRKNMIIFGDMNFKDDDETIYLLKYLEHENKDTFTYDCKLNKNAIPPFRNNLDRFYTDLDFDYKVEVLSNINISDHFPVLLYLQ